MSSGSGGQKQASLVDYFAAETTRTGDRAVSSRVHVRDDLLDEHGGLRMGAIAFAVDVATGVAMGLAVLHRDRWVVTTDLHVETVVPVTDGPLRIDAETVRAGDTTAVSAFRLYDESRGTRIGGGTVTGRPFPFDFERSHLEVPIGGTLHRGRPGPSEAAPISRYLGFRLGEDGSVEADVEDRLRNPWGILHGGVTACLVDVAAGIAGSAAMARPARVASQLVRYLAPGRVGPVRAVPEVLAASDAGALVEVRVEDLGRDGRLMAVGSCTVG